MVKVGLGFHEALALLDRFEDELDWFIDEYYSALQAREIIKDLNVAEVFSKVKCIGTEKGNNEYNKWLREKQSELEQLNEENVFAKLKNQKRGVKTVYERLKGK